MSPHPLERLGDLVTGRLDPAEHAEVEDHVKSCPDCASTIAWTRELRQQAERQGLRHLATRRIVELSRLPASATESERRHLSSCAECGGELRWVEGLPVSPGAAESEAEEDLPEAPAPAAAARLGVWLVGGLAAAAGILLFVFLPPIGPDLAGLAVVEPLPVRLTRDAPTAGSFEEQRLLGLEAYASADYAAAEAGLRRALDLRPGDDEITVYLGSAVLLQGEPARAADLLRAPAQGATRSAFRDEAAWILANALLLDGAPAEARSTLEALAGREGHRQNGAQQLLERMQASR